MQLDATGNELNGLVLIVAHGFSLTKSDQSTIFPLTSAYSLTFEFISLQCNLMDRNETNEQQISFYIIELV